MCRNIAYAFRIAEAGNAARATSEKIQWPTSTEGRHLGISSTKYVNRITKALLAHVIITTRSSWKANNACHPEPRAAVTLYTHRMSMMNSFVNWAIVASWFKRFLNSARTLDKLDKSYNWSRQASHCCRCGMIETYWAADAFNSKNNMQGLM